MSPEALVKDRRLVARDPRSPGRVQMASLLLEKSRPEALDFLVQLGCEALIAARGLGHDLDEIGPDALVDALRDTLRSMASAPPVEG